MAWALTKKATALFGFRECGGSYEPASTCNGCTSVSKILAVGYIPYGTDSFLNCITTGQTNQSVPTVLPGVNVYNRYSFTNNVWDAQSWQVKSNQNFTNSGKKTIGFYNCYGLGGCSGGNTSLDYYIIPRINCSFVSDNGNDCTLNVVGQSGQIITTASVIKLYQEINSVWTEIAITAVIPPYLFNVTHGYIPSTNVTINSADSEVPIHFKASSFAYDSLVFGTLNSYPITIATYKIAGHTYTPHSTITAADITALVAALNADLLTQGTLPTYVINTKFIDYGGQVVLTNPTFTGTLADYTIVSTTPTTYTATSNMNTQGDTETWADMWIECKYTGIAPLPPTPPNKELADYGKAYCKITDYKCIGRFSDVEDLEEIADQKLVNILATNDNFFTSLL